MALAGEAMRSTNYEDLKSPNDKTVQITKMQAANAAHPAGPLKASRDLGAKSS